MTVLVMMNIECRNGNTLSLHHKKRCLVPGETRQGCFVGGRNRKSVAEEEKENSVAAKDRQTVQTGGIDLFPSRLVSRP